MLSEKLNTLKDSIGELQAVQEQVKELSVEEQDQEKAKAYVDQKVDEAFERYWLPLLAKPHKSSPRTGVCRRPWTTP